MYGKKWIWVVALALLRICIPSLSLAQGLQDGTITDVDDSLLGLLQGSFGALVMIVAGLVGLVNCAVGNFRAAMFALVVGVGAYIFPDFLDLFFPGVVDD